MRYLIRAVTKILYLEAENCERWDGVLYQGWVYLEYITDFLWKKKSKNFLKERIPLFRDRMEEKIAPAYFRDAALKEMIFFSMPCWYPIWGEGGDTKGDKNKDRQTFYSRTGQGGGGEGLRGNALYSGNGKNNRTLDGGDYSTYLTLRNLSFIRIGIEPARILNNYIELGRVAVEQIGFEHSWNLNLNSLSILNRLKFFTVPIQKENYFKFCKVYGLKKVRKLNSPPPFVFVGSRIRDGKKSGSRINTMNRQHWWRVNTLIKKKTKFSSYNTRGNAQWGGR